MNKLQSKEPWEEFWDPISASSYHSSIDRLFQPYSAPVFKNKKKSKK